LKYFALPPSCPNSIEKKKRLLSEQVYIIVVLEFSQEKEAIPVILLFVYEELKILVEFLINLFSLFVSSKKHIQKRKLSIGKL